MTDPDTATAPAVEADEADEAATPFDGEREPAGEQAEQVTLRVQFPYGVFDPGEGLPAIVRGGTSVSRDVADQILDRARAAGAPVEQVK